MQAKNGILGEKSHFQEDLYVMSACGRVKEKNGMPVKKQPVTCAVIPTKS